MFDKKEDECRKVVLTPGAPLGADVPGADRTAAAAGQGTAGTGTGTGAGLA
jgi:hypothetical protein